MYISVQYLAKRRIWAHAAGNARVGTQHSGRCDSESFHSLGLLRGVIA